MNAIIFSKNIDNSNKSIVGEFSKKYYLFNKLNLIYPETAILTVDGVHHFFLLNLDYLKSLSNPLDYQTHLLKIPEELEENLFKIFKSFSDKDGLNSYIIEIGYTGNKIFEFVSRDIYFFKSYFEFTEFIKRFLISKFFKLKGKTQITLKINFSLIFTKTYPFQIYCRLFADNVKKRRNNYLIYANFGITEATTSSQDEYLFDKRYLDVVEVNIHRQNSMSMLIKKEIKKYPVSLEWKSLQKLEDDIIIEIGKIGVRVEKLIDPPFELEFGIIGKQIFCTNLIR